ncbi:MAG: epoxyqueuosine reductase [Chloroflexi bacterium]|nr:epoxyqueuosine reductase [Chloroflexota bacterium]
MSVQSQSELKNSITKLEADVTGIINLGARPGDRLAESARKLLPAAQSIVVFATEVYRESVDLLSTEMTTGEASLNAIFVRNSDYVCSRLNKAAFDAVRLSHRHGFKALPLTADGGPFDGRFLFAPFSYKHAAEAAGLGYFGKSSLIISPEFGPRMRLSCCLTEAGLEPTPGSGGASQCAGCQVCIDSCPAEALAEPAGDDPYAINKSACSLFRNTSGGCANCMKVCPGGF